MWTACGINQAMPLFALTAYLCLFTELCVLLGVSSLCLQNGEFHTFVIDGPIFSQPLDVKVGKSIERDGFVFCDVLPADYDEALAAAEAAAAEQTAQQLLQERQQQPDMDCKEVMKAALEEKQQQQAQKQQQQAQQQQ
jgi:hypothetical protein